jgi:hypothetical protein
MTKKAPPGKYLVQFISNVHGDIMMGNEYNEVVCVSLKKARKKVRRADKFGVEQSVILDDQGNMVI